MSIAVKTQKVMLGVISCEIKIIVGIMLCASHLGIAQNVKSISNCYKNSPVSLSPSKKIALADILSIPPSTSKAYHLESKPGSVNVIYLDFDGQFLPATTLKKYTPTTYTGPSLTLSAANVSESDIITIWKTIREDFIPFDVNVTTDSVVFNNATIGKRQKCIFTPDDEWIGVLGAALLGSFTTDEVCFAFTKYNKGKAAAEVGAHELGHTFGLTHDGTTAVPAYYNGHGTDPNTWSPIMGGSHSSNVIQWSKGEYQNANNAQDDLGVLASKLGYRTDDVGGTIATAKTLTMDINGTILPISNTGVITSAADVDVYAFSTTGGTVIINADGVSYAPNNSGAQTAMSNLDILLQLKDGAGTVLASSDHQNLLAGSITQTLTAGTYYIFIDGTSYLNPLSTGYSDYASIGEYSISGTIPLGTDQTPVVKMITRSYLDIDYPIDHLFTPKTIPLFIQASAADADGTISKVEFYNGDTKLSNATANNPYGYLLIINTAGIYTLSAKATDDDGNVSTAEPITVEVFEPRVDILTPEDMASYVESDDVTINAFADVHWSRYIDKVEFFEGATLLTTKTTRPYSYTIFNAASGAHTISVKAALSYYYTVTTTASVTFNVYPHQPGNFTESSNNICQDATNVTYSVPVDNDATYDWTYTGSGMTIISGNTSHDIVAAFSSAATSGIMSVSATKNGLTSEPQTINISVNEAPEQPSAIAGTTNPFKGSDGNAYVVADNNSVIYEWDYDGAGATIHEPGSNNISLDFDGSATSGLLSVKAINACGTSDAATLALEIIDATTGITNDENDLITLSPNPSTNRFYISIPAMFGDSDITVVNTLGQQMYNTKLSAGGTTQVSIQNSGTYVVSIRSGKKHVSKRVVIR